MPSSLAEVDDFAAVHPNHESVPNPGSAVLALSGELHRLGNQYSTAVRAPGWIIDPGGKALGGDGIRRIIHGLHIVTVSTHGLQYEAIGGTGVAYEGNPGAIPRPCRIELDGRR